ncbi:A-type flavoprotein [Spironucleus salmonicida]|uniref:A-type flavoprotein n=1 Tax=Spironucleus salmonicida TaxID=348837 RepID=V6LDX8_9EUKA|nr:A-type flavoprotein [Spironucleus salmonicida]|eukprot:EST42700.1 A-type flavoprotein [Spironucleus salmonicida]
MMHMSSNEVLPQIQWVGAIDWTIRQFHGHETEEGTTYNSYLLQDDIITLVDSVKHTLIEEHIDRIGSIIDIQQIQQIIINHAEGDHTSGLPILMQRIPHAKLICNKLCKDLLVSQFPTLNDYEFEIIDEESIINTGNRELMFKFTKVHWPESMWTIDKENHILFSNDAFGQHIACTERYADEIHHFDHLMKLFKEYIANIVSPCRLICEKLVPFILEFEPKYILTAHGVCWRGEQLNHAVQYFIQFTTNVYNQNKIVILFDTIYNQTEHAAKLIASQIINCGMKYIICDVRVVGLTKIAAELLEAKGMIVGSPTINGCATPKIMSVLRYLSSLTLINGKHCAFFGAFGWNSKSIEKMVAIAILKGGGIEVQRFEFKFAISHEDGFKLINLGKVVVDTIRQYEKQKLQCSEQIKVEQGIPLEEQKLIQE